MRNVRKLNIILITSLIFSTISLFAQGIKVSNGATLTLNQSTLAVAGKFDVNGNVNTTSVDLIFRGETNDDTLDNNGNPITLNKLVVNKSTGNLFTENNVDVNDTVKVLSGDLNLDGNSLDLGTTGYLKESPGNTVKKGTITATRDLNSPSGRDVAGLGAKITSNSDLGTTNITRGYAAQSGNGNDGINRYYNISPSNNSGLNALLEFYYDDSELNGINESSLKLYKSTDGGSTWTKEGGTVVTNDNYISLSGIDDFSLWTAAGDGAPLPVELTNFAAKLTDETIRLNWKTATEVNNYGFDIERSTSNRETDSVNWSKIGFVEGNGTSNNEHSYEFIDENLPLADSLSYRLKQIDNDGSFSYSKSISIDVSTITDVNKEKMNYNFALKQNYPNPFNPTTRIKYSIAKGNHVNLSIYNMLGQKVTTLVDENKPAGSYSVTFNGSGLASGIYIYKLSSGEKVSIKKLTLVK